MDQYFSHVTCGSSVYIDLTSNYSLLGCFGVGKKGLKITGASIIKASSEGTFKTNFKCVSCLTNITVKEIYSRCLYCGGNFTLDKLFTLDNGGGIYCPECITKFDSSNTSLLTIANKFTV